MFYTKLRIFYGAIDFKILPNWESLSRTILQNILLVKFMFSKKATRIDEIFTVDLTLCSNCQSDGEDFVNFCGLLRKHELYFIERGILQEIANSVIKMTFFAHGGTSI